jgi:hypothetical protein
MCVEATGDYRLVDRWLGYLLLGQSTGTAMVSVSEGLSLSILFIVDLIDLCCLFSLSRVGLSSLTTRKFVNEM